MTARIVIPGYDMDIELPGSENMTDEEFFDFCAQNRNTKIERDENYQIYIRPPAGLESSGMNSELTTEVTIWNRKSKLGRIGDSSSGFFLPDKSMKSPDVAWMSNEKWDSIPDIDKQKFPYVTPEFIIDLMSPSDRLGAAKEKMEKWIENGVLLGWLIDPKTETTFIYRKDTPAETVIGFDKKLSGETVLPGFEMDLSILK
ncbi:MAG: Uma2 family endonuclease [Bacteroidota bacterium]